MGFFNIPRAQLLQNLSVCSYDANMFFGFVYFCFAIALFLRELCSESLSAVQSFLLLLGACSVVLRIYCFILRIAGGLWYF